MAEKNNKKNKTNQNNKRGETFVGYRPTVIKNKKRYRNGK